MKICIIITGEIRNDYEVNNLLKYFEGYDIYCGSYIKHEKTIHKLSKNNYLINEQTDLRMPLGIRKRDLQINMLQWLHLDNIIKTYKNKLLTYDVILKFRFDYNVPKTNFLHNISTKPNILYNDSDKIFYSDSLTFIKVFENYYDSLKDYTYLPSRKNTDDSLKTSWKSEPALRLHLKKIGIKNNPLQFICGKIIRGKYNKKRGDGNKRFFK